MTIPTDIDRDAPVIARHEIDINAPLADEALTPDAKTSRCPAISARTHN